MIQSTLTPHWLVTQEKVDHVVRRIVELGQKDRCAG